MDRSRREIVANTRPGEKYSCNGVEFWVLFLLLSYHQRPAWNAALHPNHPGEMTSMDNVCFEFSSCQLMWIPSSLESVSSAITNFHAKATLEATCAWTGYTRFIRAPFFPQYMVPRPLLPRARYFFWSWRNKQPTVFQGIYFPICCVLSGGGWHVPDRRVLGWMFLPTEFSMTCAKLDKRMPKRPGTCHPHLWCCVVCKV